MEKTNKTTIVTGAGKGIGRGIAEIEKSKFDDYLCRERHSAKEFGVVLAHAVDVMSYSQHISAIVVTADEPDLVRIVSSHRPNARIFAFSKSVTRRAQMNVWRGVVSLPWSAKQTEVLKQAKLVKPGEHIITVDSLGVKLERVK